MSVKMTSNKFYEEYEKLKTVGQGAFGTATLCRRKHDGKQVVMKEVLLLDMDSGERKAALNEAEILSTLNHPNIIRYSGSFQKEGSLVIVMEYADGGNLAQLINAKKHKNEIFTEKSILNIMTQISAALTYMHSNKILHRDLKSANIFLNMNGTVKIGDFGISKMLKTRSQAQTVVGTPYYLSPEMCEGYDYNEKSDIWAMGCILYELACLTKPFEAMTLPILVQKITNCEYKEIPEMYTEELSQLVHSILQKNPTKRPTAKFIHDSLIPKIKKRHEAMLSSTENVKLGASRERSILYRVYEFGTDQRIIPEELPHKTIADFAVSSTHSLAVTVDHAVYAWGENTYGQLGSGETSRTRIYPALVKTLQREQIIRCAAGKNFSIFLNKEGIVFSCGDGRQGCLGHGDWNTVHNPTSIDSLKQAKITQICCGDEHAIALSSDGRAFTWGSSKYGQLGQGHTQYRCTPLAVKLSNMAKIKSAFCGANESVLVTVGGRVWVSGWNNCAKLGVPEREKITSFTPVALKEKIKMASVGLSHAMMLTDGGTLIAMGRNSEGQLGKRNFANYARPQGVKLRNKITTVACGCNFTVALDNRNVVWFWGSSYKACDNARVTDTKKSVRNSNSVLPLTKNAHTDIQGETIVINDFAMEGNTPQITIESVKNPRSILAFYASKANIQSGNMIYASNIKVKFNNLFILAHTTIPPPIKQFTSDDFKETSISQVDSSTVAPTILANLPNMM